MDYTETELMQVEQDLIEKAMGIDINTIENNQFRRELDFHAVLIQHDFMVGEIEEVEDLFLTLTSIMMSIVIIFASVYFCYFGLLVP